MVIEREFKELSTLILKTYWNDLLIKFEKYESDKLLITFYYVEQELKKREDLSCFLQIK